MSVPDDVCIRSCRYLDQKDPCFPEQLDSSLLWSQAGSLAKDALDPALVCTQNFVVLSQRHSPQRTNREENMGRNGGCLAFLTGSSNGTNTCCVHCPYTEFHKHGCSYNYGQLVKHCSTDMMVSCMFLPMRGPHDNPELIGWMDQ